MSDTGVEWRYLFPTETSPGRKTLFVGGVALGDYYQTSGDVFRVRCWSPFRLQGGQEQLVLTEAAAERALLAFVRKTRREEAE